MPTVRIATWINSLDTIKQLEVVLAFSLPVKKKGNYTLTTQFIIAHSMISALVGKIFIKLKEL